MKHLLTSLLLLISLVGLAQPPQLPLTITTTVCDDDVSSVRLTGPWWGWDPNGGPIAENIGGDVWAFTLLPAPTENMEYVLVADGVIEDLVGYGINTGNWSCTPLTDNFSYANRQWIVGSGNVINTFGTCDSFCPTDGCTNPLAINFDPFAVFDDGTCEFPPCEGVQNLTGQIDCFPWSPNQGEISVNWDPTGPGCDPIGFYRGTDLNNLQFIPYGPWFGNYFYGYTESTPVSSDEYYFIVESPGGILDTLILDNPNCGVGCMDPQASNYNPFAGVEDEFNPSCEYGYVSECGTDSTQNVYVSITGDTFSQYETSWEILTTDSIPQVLASEEIGFYTTVGVTVTTTYCIPLGVEFTFNIYDSWGDGLAGSTTGGSADGDVLVTTECGDTIYTILPFEGQNPNFGYGATSVPNLLNPCPPDNPPFGCKDPDYLEFNSLAENNDQSMCLTLAVPGCVDPNMFNYDPEANTMDLIPSCDYTLMLFDGGGDGWDGSYLGVVQDGEPIGAFTCTEQEAFYTINISALTHIELTFYEISFGGSFGQGGTTTDVSQCGFKLINSNGQIVYQKGNNPWLNPIEAGETYTPYLNCGNYCIPFIEGCTDEEAYNFDSLANTADGSCVYFPGCTNPLYLEYFEQGFEADVDDGSCNILVVNGCTDEEAFNYNPEANLDNEGCIPVLLGCTDEEAYNFDINANTNNGSCELFVFGCTDATAFNYNEEANTDDNSCISIIFGCTDESQFNYDPLANTEYEPSNCESFVYGCLDESAFNYDPLANTQLFGSCIPVLLGCTDVEALNYNELANTDDLSCIPVLLGCTDPTATNYNELANTDDESCIPFVYGCTDPIAYNYNILANTDDGTCEPIVLGCTDVEAYNYNELANTEDNSCLPIVFGCTDPTAFNYNTEANTDNGSCEEVIFGCTDETALNYNPEANTNNGSCTEVIEGCMDPLALNYNELANVEDGSCIDAIYGCTDPTAFNYNELANADNGTCIDVVEGCTDPSAFNYNPEANTEDFSCIEIVYGCTNPQAANYDELANTDNGTCETVYANCIDSVVETYNLLGLESECFAWVIDVSPSCCNSEWVGGCQTLYNYCDENTITNVEEFGETQVIVFPNPTRDRINIASNLRINAVLYNSIGQPVLQETNVNSLDLSQFEAGIYNLILTYDNLKFTKKIVKQ
jgi:hypothetical protein